MSNTKINIALALLLAIFVVLIVGIAHPANAPATFSEVNTGNYDTVSQGIISTTSTVNTTSTLLVSFGVTAAATSTANAVKWATIINNGTSTITCALDDRGTTAPSSTVGIDAGFVIATSSAGSIPGLLSFGQCSGFYNCIPAMGNVSCLSNSASKDINVSVIRK